MREGERGREGRPSWGGGKKEIGTGKETLREREFHVDAKK